jgi:hypothetical protein
LAALTSGRVFLLLPIPRQFSLSQIVALLTFGLPIGGGFSPCAAAAIEDCR